MASRAAEDQEHREEEQQDSSGDDDLDEEDDEAEGPAAAIAANEEEAITTLADAWAEQGGSEGPVPDVAVRGLHLSRSTTRSSPSFAPRMARCPRQR